MNGHWYVCHAAQTKLDYSTRRIIDTSKRKYESGKEVKLK